MTSDTRSFEEAYPHLKEFKAFLNVLNGESERGAALISATMIDNLLGQCIRSYLLDHKDVEQLLEGFNAPLGSFSAWRHLDSDCYLKMNTATVRESVRSGMSSRMASMHLSLTKS